MSIVPSASEGEQRPNTAPLTPEREAEIRALGEDEHRTALTLDNALDEVLAALDRVRAERDAFRDQRNGVFETNERLHATIQQEQEARLRAENETRTVTRERNALNKRLSAVLDICDREQRGAMRWENQLPVPEWVAVVQLAALGENSKAGA